MSWLVSVRGRITAAVTISFALVMVFGTWFLLDRAEQAWIKDLEAQDLAELEMIAQDLMAMEALEAMIAPDLILPVGEGGTSFFLVDEAGVLVGETPSGVFGGTVVVDGPLPADGVFPPGLGEIDLDADDITTVSLPVELASGTLTLTAASPLEPVRSGVSALRGILLVLVPLLVGGVGTTAWFVTGRAFRPVESITDQVDRITDDRLDERVPVPSSRDEVAHLARTMNRMLDRLATSRRRQRRFVSDASHELRNPIAASKAKLEVALANPEQVDWESTAEVVLEEQDRLSSLVDSLLELARLDEQGPAEIGELDLDDLIFAEVRRFAATSWTTPFGMPTTALPFRWGSTTTTQCLRSMMTAGESPRTFAVRSSTVLSVSMSRAIAVPAVPGSAWRWWRRSPRHTAAQSSQKCPSWAGPGSSCAFLESCRPRQPRTLPP